jgi:hypothetical protein
MWLKTKRKFLFLLPVITGILLYSCVEEPTIAPVAPVYTVIKVANMSNNLDAISVTIDGKQPASSLSNIAKGETTGYFDTGAGKLDFKVFNSSGDKIYEKTIDINTWERTDIVFAGDYSTDDLLNTFADFEFIEGEIYVSSKPAQDSLNIYFVHASNDVDTNKTKNYNISAQIETSDSTYSIIYASTTTSPLPLAYGGVYTVGNSTPGNYTFYFLSNAVQPDTLATSGPYTLNADMRYYLYLYGNPNSLQFSLKEVVPPPIRSRN